MAQVDFIDARVVAERPLGKGWSFLVGGRRSYFDLWLGPSSRARPGVSTAPRYYDYQVMLKKEFGPTTNLRLFFFGSDDRLEIFGSDSAGTSSSAAASARSSRSGAFRRATRTRSSANTRVAAVAAIGQD